MWTYIKHNKFKVFTSGAISLVILYFGAVAFMFRDYEFPDICQDSVIATVENDLQSYTAVVHSRDCGATTTTAYRISIIESNQELSGVNLGKGLIVSTSDYRIPNVRWVAESKLRVTNIDYEKLIVAKDKYSNLEIDYLF